MKWAFVAVDVVGVVGKVGIRRGWFGVVEI